MTRVVGFDPGRSKCGLVLVTTDSAQVLDSDVLVPEAVLTTLNKWRQRGDLEMIVMGDGTGSKTWIEPLQELTTLVQVNERGTTLKARQRYWQLWPPSYIPFQCLSSPCCRSLDASAGLSSLWL